MDMRKSRRGSLTTVVLFVLALGLLLFSTIGGAWAALNIESKIYMTYIHTQRIAIELNTDDAVKDFLGKDARWTPGKTYTGSVSCSNNGTIPEYVRVTIFKYWIDPNTGKKATGQFTNANNETVPFLSPDKILLGVDDSQWIVDKSQASPECTVLFLKRPLSVGDSQEIFNTITIDNSVSAAVKQIANPDGSVTNQFIYHGVKFGIDVLVDGVQTHHAHDAMLSAWGKNVTVSDGGPITAVG